MRILFKTFFALFSVAVLAMTGLAAYYRFVLPHTTAPGDLKVKMSPERIARGRYLFQAVSACGDCHSERDMSRVGGPFVPGRTGQGGILPIEGLPGKVVATNLTPDVQTGMGSWTDGEKLRALREGVSKDGHVLFPLMPYPSYGRMSDEDAESVIAYLNSLPPIQNHLPPTRLNFPVSLLIRSIPQPAGHVQAPRRGVTAAYGKYLATLGDCLGCHTPEDKGKLKTQLSFGGGRVFDSPVGPVVSANISPDRATGIGSWSEDNFVNRFKVYAKEADKPQPVATRSNFTFMPWLSYSQMEESDLRAIFRYLQAQKPIRNRVSIHPGQS